MRGKIISEDETRIELLDFQGNTRILWKKPGGFLLGENGRLYTRVDVGSGERRRDPDSLVEFMSLGRASSEDIEQRHAEVDGRTVKDTMVADHLRNLRQDMTLAQIAQRYHASPQYIFRLCREYEIAGIPPERKPEEPGFEKPKEYANQVNLQRIAQALLDNPGRADKWLADDLGVCHKRVAQVRARLEADGHIPKVETVLARDGKAYTVNPNLQRIRQGISDHPERTDKWLGEDLEADYRLIARVRRELERTEQIPKVRKRKTRNGREYTTRGGKQELSSR